MLHSRATQGWNRYSYVNNNPLTMIDPTGFLPMYSCKSDFNCGGGPNGSGDMGYNGLVGTDPNYQLTTTSTTVTTTYSDGTTSSFIIPDTGDSNNGPAPASLGGAPNSAQSQTSDATILNPPSLLGTGYSQTLQVQLNPGNNQLMLTA